jgi:transposase
MRDEEIGAATVAELTARVASLHHENDLLRTSNSSLSADNSTLRTDNDRLRAQLSKMLKKVFGKSSERMDAAQLRMAFASLLDEAAKSLLEENRKKAESEGENAPAKERRKREEAPRGAAAHESVERKREVVEPAEEKRTCGECKKPLSRIGEDVSSSLEWIPGHFVLVETARGKWACRCGLGTVVTAPLPSKPIEKSIASASFLAHAAVSKYQDHLPLTRQAGIFERAGVTIAVSTLSDWMHETARLLGPIRETLKAEILAGDLVRMDDTRLEMQRNSKGLEKKRCFLWEYRNAAGATVFDFTLTRSGAEPARFLGDFRGLVQSDGYAAHDQLFTNGSGRRRVGCWAHSRRRFVDAMESAPAEASLAVALIARLYDVEREARERALGPAQRSRLRRERCPPIFEMLKCFLDEWSLSALPKSPLGEAVGYALSQWKTLTAYVDDGRLQIDNNEVESAIRGIALGRKNHLFVGSEQGGHDAALFYSLIESCKAAGAEPMAYFQDVLGRVAVVSDAELRALTPARWKADRDAAAAPTNGPLPSDSAN